MIGLHSKWIKRTHPKSAEESDAEWVPTMAKGSKPDKAWVTLRQSILRFCISFVLPAYLYFRQVYRTTLVTQYRWFWPSVIQPCRMQN